MYAAHTQRTVQSDEDQQVHCWFSMLLLKLSVVFDGLFKRNLLHRWSKSGSASCCSHVVVLCFSFLSPCFSPCQRLRSLVPSLLWQVSQRWNPSPWSQSSCAGLSEVDFSFLVAKGVSGVTAPLMRTRCRIWKYVTKGHNATQTEGGWGSLTGRAHSGLFEDASVQSEQTGVCFAKLNSLEVDIPRSLVSSTLCWRWFPWQQSTDTYVEAPKNFGSGL